jgi:hypothetical protein
MDRHKRYLLGVREWQRLCKPVARASGGGIGVGRLDEEEALRAMAPRALSQVVGEICEELDARDRCGAEVLGRLGPGAG